MPLLSELIIQRRRAGPLAEGASRARGRKVRSSLTV
jgi:hypothetical protein